MRTCVSTCSRRSMLTRSPSTHPPCSSSNTCQKLKPKFSKTCHLSKKKNLVEESTFDAQLPRRNPLFSVLKQVHVNSQNQFKVFAYLVRPKRLMSLTLSSCFAGQNVFEMKIRSFFFCCKNENEIIETYTRHKYTSTRRTFMGRLRHS